MDTKGKNNKENLDVGCKKDMDPEMIIHDEEPPSYNELYNTPSISGSEDVKQHVTKVETKTKKTDGDADPQSNDITWREILYDFTQNTSLHGLGQITQPQSYTLRRIFWLLVFLGSAALLLLQLALSVDHYISWPVTVDVKINYNDSILFPTVTICNENAFRTTAAYEKGYYFLLSDLFVGPHPNVNFKKYNASHVSLETLHKQIGHRGNDLIVRCEWEGMPCSLTDFVPQITDFGMCYTFNGGKRVRDLRMASTTGSGGGLRLQLNIEQYEYMRGPNEGAGLKILIHNYNEIPRVKDHGVAVPPGAHAFMSVKTTEVTNLEPEHGKCNDSVKLQYFDDYTVENCFTNCKEIFVLKRCNCRDVYMPGNQDVCTLSQYQDCLLGALEKFSQQKDMCTCPIPCHRLMYEPVVSYASTSNFDIFRLLRSKSTEELRKKFLNAREINQKVNKAIVKEDTEMIQSFNKQLRHLSEVLPKIKNMLNKVMKEVVEKQTIMQQHVDFHLLEGLENVHSMMENNFIREWEHYKERSFNQLTFDFMGLPTLLKGAIEDGNGTIPFDDRDNRKLLVLPVETKLYRKLTVISMSKRHILYIVEGKYRSRSVKEGPSVITYRSHYDGELISEILLDSGIEAVGKEAYYEQFVHFEESIEEMDKAIRIIIDVSHMFAENNFFNETLYEIGKDLWINSCARFNTLVYEYDKLIVTKPRQLIQEAIQNFKLDRKAFIDAYTVVIRKVNFIKESMNSSMDEQWDLAAIISELSNMYLSQYNITKEEIAELVTSGKVDESFYALTLFFKDIQLWVKDLQNELTNLQTTYNTIWEAMLEDPYTKKLYKSLNRDAMIYIDTNQTYPRVPHYARHLYRVTKEYTEYTFLELFIKILADSFSKREVKTMSTEEIITAMNGYFHVMKLDEVLRNESDDFNVFEAKLNDAYNLAKSDQQFMEEYEKYKASLSSFLKGNVVTPEFFRENFMRVDIFLQELRYEEIKQQKAYDIIQLLSDIGGSMGLFLGASVLSIIEFFDIFMHQAAKRMFNKRNKQ